jgi:hypothetical protein
MPRRAPSHSVDTFVAWYPIGLSPISECPASLSVKISTSLSYVSPARGKNRPVHPPVSWNSVRLAPGLHHSALVLAGGDLGVNQPLSGPSICFWLSPSVFRTMRDIQLEIEAARSS